jgi:ABC-type antimicrobial peptide transport system permease subunit
LIGPLGFAVRNLKRRGFHTLLAFLGLTITIGSTTFLILLAQTLMSSVGLEIGARSTLGISWLFIGYLQLSLAFVLIVGLLSSSHLVSSMINQRTRDIGVIKAAGCITPRLFAYSLTEAMLVFPASSLVGGLAALLLLFSWAGTFQMDQTSVLILIGIPLASFILSYIMARVQVGRLVNKTETPSAISSYLSSLNLKKLGKPLRVKRFGSEFNLASRTVLRSKHFTRTFLRICICIFLTTVVLTGALVSWDTSKNYVERAMPAHVLTMGTRSMVDAYRQLGLTFSSSASPLVTNYLAPTNMINASVVDILRGTPGVQTVDTRLVNLTLAEGYSTQFVEGPSGDQQLVGPTYLGSSQILIVGIDPNQIIGDWHTSDGFLTMSDPQNTMVVGDSLIGGIVQQPFNGSQIHALTASFNVKGALVDPLNRGNVAFASVRLLQQLLNINGYNLLLVETDNNPTTLQRVQGLANSYGLAVGSQDEILNADTSFLDSIWSHIMILPILTLTLTCAILLSYLSTSFSLRFADYTILKVLGAKARYSLKLLLWEGWGVLAFSMLLTLPLALIFSVLLIVPDVKAQALNLALSTAAPVLGLSLVAVASAAIYWRRLNHVSVKDLTL